MNTNERIESLETEVSVWKQANDAGQRDLSAVLDREDSLIRALRRIQSAIRWNPPWTWGEKVDNICTNALEKKA